MIKKSLLIGSAVLLASSPLLVAQKDILIFGSDTLAGGQNVAVSDNKEWVATGTSTGVNVRSIAEGGSFADTLQALPFPQLSEREQWDESSQAFSVLSGATGIKSKDDLNGIKGGMLYQTSNSIANLLFSGFQVGQEYEVTLWIKTLGPASNTDLNIAVSKANGIIDGTVFSGLYNSSVGDETSFGLGSSVVLGNQGDYAVRFSFTAGAGVDFQLFFSKPVDSDGNTARPVFDIGLITIAAVPEPSAFGLLAGVGALALTVSRRKRSRRS